MEEWKEYKLKDICIKITDGSHSSPRGVDDGYPMFSVKDMQEYGFDYSKCKYVSYDDFLSLKQNDCVPQKGDVLVAKDGSYLKQIFVCKETRDEGILSSIAIFRPNTIVDSFFLCYLLKSPEVYNYIANNCVSGSALPRIVLKDFKEVKLRVPSLTKQKEIVSILKSLDDKIEVNRKINENLEQQAQALFKSWFVDFEPFKNREFVESELGRIPKGWRVGKLGELCEFKRGKGLLSKNAIPGDVPVVAGGLEPACYHNVSNTKAPVITVSGSGANAGFMRMYHQEVWASDCSFIDISCVNWLFVYCFLAINSHLLRNAQTGAVQPHVKPADIHDFVLVIPPKEFIQSFQDKISFFIKKKGLIEQESRRLAELRDTLLPRLMSGELSVNHLDG